MIKRGHQRLMLGPGPEAVAWWYVEEFADGFVYARGGRCRTTREARRLMRDHAMHAKVEHQAFTARPVARLTDGGKLVPIDFGPYGIEHRR